MPRLQFRARWAALTTRASLQVDNHHTQPAHRALSQHTKAATPTPASGHFAGGGNLRSGSVPAAFCQVPRRGGNNRCAPRRKCWREVCLNNNRALFMCRLFLNKYWLRNMRSLLLNYCAVCHCSRARGTGAPDETSVVKLDRVPRTDTP
jgi:hypothetical protein